jgi:hypothetical protein
MLNIVMRKLTFKLGRRLVLKRRMERRKGRRLVRREHEDFG